MALLTLGAAPLGNPLRIMSINQCNDLALLMLVPKERIASITYLAHDPATALFPGRDAGVPVNHGTAEEILRDKPDLILAGAWTTPVARRLAKQVGAPIVEIEAANSFADIRIFMRHLGKVVGEPARAEALIRQMDAELGRLATHSLARHTRVVAWSGGWSVPGHGTLTDAIITAAGAENIGARYADARSSSFGLEELAAARPDAVMVGTGSFDRPSLHRGLSRHPLIDRLFAGRQIDYPDAAYSCGLPQSAEAAVALRRALAQIPAGPVRW